MRDLERVLARNVVKSMATLILLGSVVSFLMMPENAGADGPLTESDFVLAAPQGFGNRQNGWSWSMQWWNGYLYVGTNRAWHCVETAALNRVFPELFLYPPADSDIECTPDPADLPLQAEIWRWTPETNIWERVYQSPNDVPIPGKPGKFVGREIGYRGMNVFTEPDGVEALYVAGVSSQFLWSDVPPPRLLRSIDGLHFEPVPQEPGTNLGDFPLSSMRNQISFKGRFYVVGGIVQGSGVLLEADNPAAGNDNFRVVSPPDRVISAVAAYNDHLYVGTHAPIIGYSVLKTAASGPPPYTYTPIVEKGGYLPLLPNQEILHMKVFKDRLYVGGNGVKGGITALGGPAELIRINPDDTWDVVVGKPRETPSGWKFPISGFGAGFDNFFNGHMWRMEVYDEHLFVGTFDSSTVSRDNPLIGPFVKDIMGFDLYSTPNGIDFFPITTKGFGDIFNFGVRSLEATPQGLFLGTANYYYGLQIWRTQGRQPAPTEGMAYLPMIVRTAPLSSPLNGELRPYEHAARLTRPLVETEVSDEGVVVSWLPAVGQAQSRVMRIGIQTISLPLGAKHITLTDATLPEYIAEEVTALSFSQNKKTTIWTRPMEVGITTNCYFVDHTAEAGQRYIYYVEAIDRNGQHVSVSNIAPAPTMALPATMHNLNVSLVDWRARGYLTTQGNSEITQTLTTVQSLIETSNFASAVQTLADLRARLEQEGQTLTVAWKAEDLCRFLARFEQRVRLAQAGILDPLELN